MGQAFHTKYIDGLTALNANDLDAPMSSLDNAIGNLGQHAFAIARGPISVDCSDSAAWYVKYPIIDIYHHKNDALGTVIHNYVAAGTTNLIGSSTSVVVCRYVTLSETDGALLTISSPTDYDAQPTGFGKDKFILFVRARGVGTGHSDLYFPGILRGQPLRGTIWSLAGASTTTVVTFPTGITLQDTAYMVILTPKAAGWYALDPYVSTKGTSSFTITHANTGAGSYPFDYLIVP